MTRRSQTVAWADPALLILGSLADGPRHGYAMTSDIAESAGVALGPGTLYGAIARLERAGLIEALPGDDRRRPYRLTAAGAAMLSERLAAMQKFSRLGLARLRAAVGG